MIRFWNKLSVKLFFAVAVSFIVSLAGISVLSNILVRFVLAEPIEEMNILLYNVLVIVIFSSAIILFIISLWLFIKKKIIFLNEISDGVQSIAGGNLSHVIEVKGRDELARLGENINQMSKELEARFLRERELEKNKNELITNISHDLRTPLTSIIGYLDLLENRGNLTEQQAAEYLAILRFKSQRLKHLLDELFTYNKLTSPDIQVKKYEVNLAGIIRQLAGEYIPILEDRSLKMEVDIPEEEVTAPVDVEQIIRVFENLLSNAVNYSLKPSVIQLSLKTRGHQAVFTLANRVNSKPEGSLDTLFERFYRGDQSRKEDGGTGLGLAIARRIAELHGGHLEADYEEGWLIFTLSLPLTGEHA
ncbi:ATP-binding protein [Metabacillus sp. SLBN-84]